MKNSWKPVKRIWAEKLRGFQVRYMNANDGVSSSMEGSSNENKKDQKENVEIENHEAEVETKADAASCDIKPLGGWKYVL